MINKMQKLETQAHRSDAILERVGSLIRDMLTPCIYISPFGSRKSLVICHE